MKFLPTLTSLTNGETLFFYLAMAEDAISAILIQEKSGLQHPIYYIRRAINGPESQYISTEKLVLCLIHVAYRFKSYFLVHLICVRTDQFLR